MEGQKIGCLRTPRSRFNFALNALGHVPLMGSYIASAFTAAGEGNIPQLAAGILWVGAMGAMKKAQCDRPYMGKILEGEFLQEGPFSQVRHPIYAFQRAAAVGMQAICPSFPGIIMAGTFIGMSEALARSEETDQLAIHGEKYGEYMEKTPRWIPRGVNSFLEETAIKYQPAISALSAI
jgi:protein-S-isoprenylcysteine O-methyltransferase Ste14